MPNSSEIFEDLEKLTHEARLRKLELNSALSKIDREKSDILHYIEFYPLNACQGYKMAKMLKDCLIERRKVKNEAEELDRISRMNVGFIGNGKGKAALAKVKEKQYRPRVLRELFEKPPTNSRKEDAHEIPY